MVNLSKSKYCALWQCPKMLWLRKYKPELAEVDSHTLSIMETGNAVGYLAMGLFGDFTEIQEEIRRKCPEDHFTLIMRRFMMRLANMLALELRCRALVTGENLGQVASQTMQALAVSEDVTTMPVLRPLIGMDKEEIVKIARHIGTFDTSILPYEDCCTVFTPRHPKTKPSVEETREYESALDVEGLCQRAMAGREMIRIKPTL